MTGFGHAERSVEGLNVAVDIKTVNSRYFDFKAHIGREWLELDPILKAEVQAVLSRGRVDVFVDVSATLPDQLRLDVGMARSYLGAADSLREAGASGELTVAALISLPGVLVRSPLSLEVIRDPLVEALREALGRVVEARRAEGAALREEISSRFEALRSSIQRVTESAALIRDYYLERLKKQIALLAAEVEIDDRRLAQEVFYYVERSDIAEELARLESHFSRFREYLSPEGGEPVGKNLDFLCQEINREVNTILAKSNMVGITESAVAAKAEVERIREQVQNVE